MESLLESYCHTKYLEDVLDSQGQGFTNSGPGRGKKEDDNRVPWIDLSGNRSDRFGRSRYHFVLGRPLW